MAPEPLEISPVVTGPAGAWMVGIAAPMETTGYRQHPMAEVVPDAGRHQHLHRFSGHLDDMGIRQGTGSQDGILVNIENVHGELLLRTPSSYGSPYQASSERASTAIKSNSRTGS